jgi:hypothetical protein
MLWDNKLLRFDKLAGARETSDLENRSTGLQLTSMLSNTPLSLGLAKRAIWKIALQDCS